jgi:hypothetical protein
MMKVLKKLGIEGIYLNSIKSTHDKPIGNIILKGEKIKSFSLRSAMRQGCPQSALLPNIMLVLLARGIRQEKETKGIQMERNK